MLCTLNCVCVLFRTKCLSIRPILAILSTTAEVRYVLTHRSSLPSCITIKPDHSSSERRVEKILLSERWKLIQAGSDCHSIKISNSCLYLNGSLCGKVVDSTYCQVPFLGDLAPTFSDLSNTAAPTGDDIQSPPSQTPAPSSSIDFHYVYGILEV